MRRVLADCVCTVVTAGTVAGDIHMIEIRRKPANRAVTIVTGIATGDMCRVFSGGGDSVVAGAATAEHLGVINGYNRYKRDRRVAVFTDICRTNVGWALVDSRYRRKDNRAVAVFANICRLHVRRVFADRLGTVVTADTITSDVHMIEKHGQPASCAVTVVAGIAARDVSRVFADGSGAIMARATSTDYLGVIDRKHGRPNCRAMAIFANIACLYMGWVLQAAVM